MEKKKFTRGQITGITVVAVVLVAAIGMLAWHNTPSFCSTVCHQSMSYYVDTYTSGDCTYGVTAHADADESCLDCHEAKTTEQITEVMATISGDYEMTAEGQIAEASVEASEEMCLVDGCHTWEDVVEATWGFEENDEKYNPHVSHQDNLITCSDCHSMHSAQTLYCAKCHSLNLPEGWEATSDN